MARRLVAFLAVFIPAAACDGGSPVLAPADVSLSSAPGEDGAEIVPGHYIVVFRDDVADVDAKARDLVGRQRGKLRRAYRAALKGFAAELSAEAAAELAADPSVARVVPDRRLRVDATTQSSAVWGLDRIDQRALPLNRAYAYTATGAGVTAYVIDTGIRTDHAEFGGRASTGVDEVDGGSADDCNGHGTHVAGTIGGATHGVAKGVRLVAVRVAGCDGSGMGSDVLAGIDWVTANHRKPAVANMSMGGGVFSVLDDAVRRAIAAGVTFVVSAGNSNTNACGQSPALLPEAVTVGATTSSDARASYSNHGSCLDLFAPGSNITSAAVSGSTATVSMSGTSMASPHVAGAAALYLETHPAATPAATAAALNGSATTGKVTSAGTGSPNRLLYSLLTTIPAGNRAPTVSAGGPYTGVEGTGVAFSAAGTADADGDSVTTYRWSFGDGTSSTAASPSKSYADDGTYTVTLTVEDVHGASATATTTATIGNAAPTATLSAPSSISEGAGYKVSLSGTDPGTADRSTLEYALDCGLGAGFSAWSATVKSATCPVQADQRAPVTVSGKVRDKEGAVTTYTRTVAVNNAVPVVTLRATSAAALAVGGTLSLEGSFTDKGVNDQPWTYTFVWGDGTASTSGTLAAQGTAITSGHRYAKAGSWTAYLTVRDKDGRVGRSASVVVTVAP